MNYKLIDDLMCEGIKCFILLIQSVLLNFSHQRVLSFTPSAVLGDPCSPSTDCADYALAI
jgi:hypothetical protein